MATRERGGFKEEFIKELRQAEAGPGAESAGDFLVVTGAGSARLWEELRARLAMTFPEIDLEIMAVANSFFGPMVTVTGLVTGEDITRTFKAQKVKPGRTVLIPEVMLAYGKEVFLDGMSLGELQKGLGFPVRVVANSGKEAVRALLGLKGERQ